MRFCVLVLNLGTIFSGDFDYSVTVVCMLQCPPEMQRSLLSTSSIPPMTPVTLRMILYPRGMLLCLPSGPSPAVPAPAVTPGRSWPCGSVSRACSSRSTSWRWPKRMQSRGRGRPRSRWNSCKLSLWQPIRGFRARSWPIRCVQNIW